MLSISSRVCLSRRPKVPFIFPKYWPKISMASIPTLTFITYSLQRETSSGKTSVSSLLPLMVDGSLGVSLSLNTTSNFFTLVGDILLLVTALSANDILSDVG